MATKKEVKKPRKPAIKRISKAKKEAVITPIDNCTVEVTEINEENDSPVTRKDIDDILDPKEVITEFTDATKKLDDIVISENSEEILREELKKAEEVQEKLEEQIKEKEEKLYNPGRKTWNGVTDGWYDY